MKRIIPLFLICLPVWASTTATSTISMDDMEQMLKNALSTAQGLSPAWLGAAYVIVIILTMAFLAIARYFNNKNAREEESYKESKRLELEHNMNAQRIATDYITAKKDLLTSAYLDDLELYKKRIAEKNYPSVLVKISPTFHDAISTFLYDESQTPEIRASRIIYLLTK